METDQLKKLYLDNLVLLPSENETVEFKVKEPRGNRQTNICPIKLFEFA